MQETNSVTVSTSKTSLLSKNLSSILSCTWHMIQEDKVSLWRTSTFLPFIEEQNKNLSTSNSLYSDKERQTNQKMQTICNSKTIAVSMQTVSLMKTTKKTPKSDTHLQSHTKCKEQHKNKKQLTGNGLESLTRLKWHVNLTIGATTFMCSVFLANKSRLYIDILIISSH